MPSLLQIIKDLIPALPKSDIPYAYKFYNNRDWESLRDLTLSAWKRYKLHNAKYKTLDADKLAELAMACEDYYYLIYPPWEEELGGNFEDDEDEDEDEEEN